jgi:hypothetical protein
MRRPLMTGMLAGAALWGCTTPVPAPSAGSAPAASPAPLASPAPAASPVPSASIAASTARYRCEHDIEFSVQFANDSAIMDAGPRGTETLLRDAGGATPQQTVYSSERIRVEFGLGVSGREAILRYALPPLVAHCIRD